MKRILLSIFAMSSIGTIVSQANFTDISPDEVVNATYTGESYQVDFDNDLNPEIIIFGLKKDTSISSFPGTITGIAITTLGNSAIAGSSQTFGTETVLVADLLSASDAIDASLSYVNSSTPAIFPGVGLGADAAGFTTLGNFSGAGFKYFGVRFEIGGNQHYGWVRVSVTANSAMCTIDSYGYEETTSTVSYAGDMGSGTVAVDEASVAISMYSANGMLYVLGTDQGQVQVFNLLGEEVKKFNVSNRKNISIEDLKEGVYLVRFSLNGKVITKKIAK